MTTKTDVDKPLAELGYALTMGATDWMGRKWKYRVSPICSSGGTSYFDNITDLRNWILDVQIIRAMQANDDVLLRRLQLKYYARRHPVEFAQNAEWLLSVEEDQPAYL